MRRALGMAVLAAAICAFFTAPPPARGAEPQFTTELAWKLAPKVNQAIYTFEKPADATRIEIASPDDAPPGGAP